ncbi:MAG: elongation factor P [Candidatus Pacebacteria bacterium]|nr:elongation factor P [Candidatus Paceibacterota bacterium]
MISSADLKKDLYLIMDSQPWMVVEVQFVSPGKGSAFYRTKLKNLKSGNVVEKTFKSGEHFEEANIEKTKAKFLYSHRDKYVFTKADNPSVRFELPQEIIGNLIKYLTPNQIVDGLLSNGEIINISLPIKIYLKVKDAPIGIKGDRAQGGTKTVTLESGATVEAPLFIETGDTLEINTETGEYVRRVEK